MGLKAEKNKMVGSVKEKVSLRRRIEELEEAIYKLKEETSPLIEEIEKIKDYVGIS